MFKIDKERVIVEDLNYPGYDETADIEVINENFRKLKEKNESQDNEINGKEPAFEKKSGFNLEKTDLVEDDSNKVITPKGVLNLKNWLVEAYTNAINTTKSALESLIGNKLNHGGYGGTGQDLKNDINFLDNNKVKSNGYVQSLPSSQTPWNAKTGIYREMEDGRSSLVFQMLAGDASCASAQMKFEFGNGGVYYRTSRDAYGFEGRTFQRFYTTEFPPTAKDVNAYSKSESDSRYLSIDGGTVNGLISAKDNISLTGENSMVTLKSKPNSWNAIYSDYTGLHIGNGLFGALEVPRDASSFTKVLQFETIQQNSGWSAGTVIGHLRSGGSDWGETIIRFDGDRKGLNTKYWKFNHNDGSFRIDGDFYANGNKVYHVGSIFDNIILNTNSGERRVAGQNNMGLFFNSNGFGAYNWRDNKWIFNYTGDVFEIQGNTNVIKDVRLGTRIEKQVWRSTESATETPGYVTTATRNSTGDEYIDTEYRRPLQIFRYGQWITISIV